MQVNDPSSYSPDSSLGDITDSWRRFGMRVLQPYQGSGSPSRRQQYYGSPEMTGPRGNGRIRWLLYQNGSLMLEWLTAGTRSDVASHHFESFLAATRACASVCMSKTPRPGRSSNTMPCHSSWQRSLTPRLETMHCIRVRMAARFNTLTCHFYSLV